MILNNLTHIAYKNSDLTNNPFLLIFFFLFGINLLVAQRPHCHADEMIQHQLAEQGLEHQLQDYKQSLKNLSPTRDEGVVHTIPVVVHVIHSGESIGSGSNLSIAKIMEQMSTLNNDFNQLNTDQNQIPSEFASRAANVELEFCLAQTDPSGNTTSGITRTQFGSISSISFIENNIKPQTQWDPRRYMNVWIVRMPDANILGYSYLPIPAFLNRTVDGVVISHLKIGNQGSTTKGRTLVHEVGHYFGLPHLWGENENDCDEDDQIADTPAVRAPYYGHPVYPQFTCGTSDMFMNYMEYVNDNCMFMFTEGQKTVMRSIVNNQRLSLLNNSETACSTTVSTAPSPQLNELVKIFPNPCYEELAITVPDNQIIKELTIFDSAGKMVDFQSIANESGSKTRYIDTNAFQNGMFILRIETHTGETYAKRFVKLAN